MQQYDHPYSQATGLSLCVDSKSINNKEYVCNKFDLLLQSLPVNPSKLLLLWQSYINML